MAVQCRLAAILAADRLLSLLPNENLEFAHRVVPAGQPELLEIFVEGLRMAGLPE